MNSFIDNTKKLLFLRQKDILSSAIIISTMILISRFFGFIRYRTLATYFTKEELDLFFAAFRIPDFVFEVIITGALSSAFIPIYIKYNSDKNVLNKKISTIANFIIAILLVCVFFLFIFSKSIMRILAPGFSEESILIVSNISKILLIAQLPFFVIGNIFSGIAQANKIFIISAIAPVLYNIGIIIGTITLSSSFWLYGPVTGVVGGAFLFFLIQLPILFKTKFSYFLTIRDKKTLKEFTLLFVPRMLSVIANQIDLTIDLTLSTLLGAGSYTIFFFSQQLQLLPVSLIGMAFGQASLPYISDLFNQKKFKEIKKIFVLSILQLLYVSIPFSLFLIFARTPIVRLVFGGRKFDWVGTNLTAMSVSFFALSVPLHTIFYFITRSFYAMHDTKTPFIINFICIAINVIVSIYLVIFLKWPVWALAFSFSITIAINIFLLLALFWKKIDGFDIKTLILHSAKIYFIAVCATIPSYITLKLLDLLVLDTTRTFIIVFLICIIGFVYGCFYLFLSWTFNIEEIYILGKLFLKVKKIQKKIIELYTGST